MLHMGDAGPARICRDSRERRRADAARLGGPVDFILIDGWPLAESPSLARQVIEVAAPQLCTGGYVMNDNAEPDFLEPGFWD